MLENDRLSSRDNDEALVLNISSSKINDSDTLKSQLKLNDNIKSQISDKPDVLDFILFLQKYIKKQKGKIKKLKEKLKKIEPKKDAEIQTDFTKAQSTDVDETLRDENPTQSIVQDIKNAAEEATQNSGFVYEETSGMYYDYNTGYYYNAEYGLYYDGNSGTYLSYNQNTQTYEFHSQVATKNTKDSKTEGRSKENNHPKRKTRTRTKPKERKRRRRSNDEDGKADLEEGECSSETSETSDEDKAEMDADHSDESDISKQWPPCMRVIVEETTVPKLKVGSLFIITYEGGTIGREGDKHSVIIPDINISKHHLKISFDEETSQYRAVDLGSRNGSILNGKRMSSSKQESEAYDVVHGSRLVLGATTLLCHIHEGNQTCGHCEPGLLTKPDDKKITLNRTTKTEWHKNELKNLRKKFGMNSYEEEKTKLPVGYTDRAQKRRETVGSQNPHEKTEAASAESSISSENKGFKLLAKMGWKEGQSLGKDGQGILEPVPSVGNVGTAGIGSDPVPENVPINKSKQKLWKKTQERFEKLTETSDAFEEQKD